MPQISSPYLLFNCSCFELFTKLPRASIDLVLTDPPYGATIAKWDKRLPTNPLWGGIHRVMKPNAAVVLMAAQPYTSQLITANLEEFRYCWTWYKPNCNSGYLASANRPLSAVEELIVFYQKQPTYNPQMGMGKKYFASRRGFSGTFKSNGKMFHTANDGGRFPRNVIVLPHAVSNRINETQKPVELMEYMIKTYTNPGDKVLDFTMGSGTTGVACAKLGRKFVGCEIDHSQFVRARARIRQAYEQSLGLGLGPRK
jgi:DNA modification methylase